MSSHDLSSRCARKEREFPGVSSSSSKNTSLSDTGPTLTLLSSLLLKALSLNTVTLRASTEGLGRGYNSGLNKWYELRLK